MLEAVVVKTNEYIENMPKAQRKLYGQFVTSLQTARFMAEMYDFTKLSSHVKVLDAGAGSGILACALLERLAQEKFVENFTRRFTETSTFGQGNYSIEFYQISEYPAKVSLRIVDSTNSYNIYNTYSVDIDATQINVVNELSAILDGYK